MAEPAERSFIEVEGVRLHYSDRGSGRPVVLIHSNIVTGDDYNTSAWPSVCSEPAA